jgi:hypothetical protein
MPGFILPVELHFHDPDWRIVFAIVAAVLAFGGPEVAKLGAALMCVVYGGLIVVGLVESRPAPPCTTHVMPPPPVM